MGGIIYRIRCVRGVFEFVSMTVVVALDEEGPYFVLYFEHDYEFARTCSFFNDSLPEIVHKVTEE